MKPQRRGDTEEKRTKKKTCAKRKTKRMLLVKVFTFGKKVVGKAFLFKKKFLVKYGALPHDPASPVRAYV